MDTPKKGRIFNTQFRRPILNWERATVICDVLGTPSISRLLGIRGPAAVTRFIVAIVINAFEASSKWPLAHVPKEKLKSVPPSAYLDASGTVVFERPVVRIYNADSHRHPREIGGRFVDAAVAVPIITGAA
jgi:hypothetical protein